MQTKITGETTDTHFPGSGALSWPWYDIQTYTGEGTDTWRITFKDGAEPADEEAERVYTLDHETVMEGVRMLARAYVDRGTWRQFDRTEAKTETMRQCCLFLADPDCADFDADTADQVLQVAAFGKVIYG